MSSAFGSSLTNKQESSGRTRGTQHTTHHYLLLSHIPMDSSASGTGMYSQRLRCFELICFCLERRSTRPRNTGGPRARLEELGEVLAAPTHKKKTAVAAPTTGDRGRALASQSVRIHFYFIAYCSSLFYSLES